MNMYFVLEISIKDSQFYKMIPHEDVICSNTIILQQLNMKESCTLTIQFNDDDIVKLLSLG